MTENNYTKKYIFGQGRGDVAEMKLGRHKVSYNGCGAVALYNALTEKGKETGFPEVLSFFEKLIHLGGIFGITFGNMKKALSHFGLTFHVSRRKDEYAHMVSKGGVYIVLMNNARTIFGGRHWVMFTVDTAGRVLAYNAAQKSCAAEYASFDSFLERYIQSGGGSISALFRVE